MPDRGTRNEIFVLKRLIERSIEKQRDVYACFIDYSKAFDIVKHEPLIEMLQNLDIKEDIRVLTTLYWNQQAVVRCNGEIGIKINKVCCNVVIMMMMRNIDSMGAP